MLPLFTLTIFAGAALLFLVQPMTARTVLPLLGGGPAVWTTCMLFFQITLLGGYLYAHVLTSRLRLRGQVIVHAGVLLAALAASALVERPSEAPPPGQWPVPWLLATLLITVGPAFFAVSTAGPLLQRWFTGVGHRRSTNPYFLYAASNAGSLLGLLAYPFVVEPALGLTDQRQAWVFGFGCFVLLAAACGVVAVVLGRHRGGGPASGEPAEPAARVTWRQRGWWAFLAFIPSSLMIGVTSYLSTDIAVFPLLWVIPLGLYLLSFMLAFGRFGARLAGALSLPSVVAMVVLVTAYVATAMEIRVPPLPLLTVHLAGFAVIATWVHARLAASAPPAARLTEFYLLLSIGGALGGVFNALIAPQVFLLPVEYTLVLAAAGLARPWGRPGGGRRRGRLVLLLLPPALYAVQTVMISRFSAHTGWPDWVRAGVLLWPIAVFSLAASRHGLALGLTLGVAVVSATAVLATQRGLIYIERSFYGTLRVNADSYEGNRLHSLYHGSTLHGRQVLSDNERLRRLPLSYYSHFGPVGDVMEGVHLRYGDGAAVAVLGLGTGGLAGYCRPQDSFTFFEIDPAVVGVANDPALFTYLRDAPGGVRVILGDGRRSLEALPPEDRFDVIVLDAFSSDSIPVHLLTREAFDLYTSRLNPDGLLLVHVSNRYMTLNPIVANIAADMAASARGTLHMPTRDEALLGAVISDWMVVTPRGHAMLPLPTSWGWAFRQPQDPTWTDEYSDVASTINWLN